MRRTVLFGVTLALGLLALSVAPDIRRYFKIATM